MLVREARQFGSVTGSTTEGVYVYVVRGKIK